MKHWKQKLAAILVAAMTVNSTAIVSLAEENKPEKPGWFFDEAEKVWYRYNGEMKMQDTRIISGNADWYLGNDGKMAADELIFVKRKEGSDPAKLRYVELEDENELWNYPFEKYDEEIGDQKEFKLMYARPSGALAKNKWVMLDGNGQITYDEDGSDWYFFGKDWDAYRNGMYRIKNKQTNERQLFGFDKDGVMYQNEWWGANDASYIAEEGDTSFAGYYFNGFGNAIENKVVCIDGEWYDFTDKDDDNLYYGQRVSEMKHEDTDFDTELYLDELNKTIVDDNVTIEGIEDGETNATIGRTRTLKFHYTLASSSNATPSNATPGDAEYVDAEDFEQYHDYYVWRDFGVNDDEETAAFMSKNVQAKITDIEADKTGGIITVECDIFAKGAVELTLQIDDIDTSVIIYSNYPAEMASKDKETLIDNGLSTGDGLEAASVNALKASVEEMVSGNLVSSEEMEDFWMKKQNSVSGMESQYGMIQGITVAEAAIDEEAAEKLSAEDIKIVGASLNMTESGTAQLEVADVQEDDLEIEAEQLEALDIELSLGGDKPDELDLPVIITIPVPEGFDADQTTLYHIHDGETEELDVKAEGDNLTFAVSSFSTFVFAQGTPEDSDDGNEGDDVVGGDDSNSGSSSSDDSDDDYTSQSSQVTVDDQKGHVDVVTGIITGNGDEYSQWVEETKADGSSAWKLQYADNTMAAGSIVTRADGTTYEQVAWELVDGKWFPFGADSFVKSDWVYDVDLAGWFFVDINEGMMTGWNQIAGRWYYLNPVSDGKKGIRLADCWIDGWYVNADGIWDGSDRAVVRQAAN